MRPKTAARPLYAWALLHGWDPIPGRTRPGGLRRASNLGLLSVTAGGLVFTADRKRLSSRGVNHAVLCPQTSRRAKRRGALDLTHGRSSWSAAASAPGGGCLRQSSRRTSSRMAARTPGYFPVRIKYVSVPPPRRCFITALGGKLKLRPCVIGRRISITAAIPANIPHPHPRSLSISYNVNHFIF